MNHLKSFFFIGLLAAWAGVSQAAAPIASHDFSECYVSRGWACDPDDYNASLEMHFYVGGPPGVGTYIGNAVANRPRINGLGGNCGVPSGITFHDFEFLTPDSLKNGQNHTIYAYAINVGSAEGNPLISYSPKTFSCSFPTITSPLTVSAPVGVPFSYQITTSGSPEQLRYSILGIPTQPVEGPNYSGISLNPTTGVISGIPTTMGNAPPITHFLTMTATNVAGPSAPALLRLTITAPPPPPVITSTLTATGVLNTPFTYQIIASNSPTSYTSLNLHPGLTLNTTTGLISGTPTATGFRYVTLTAVNSSGSDARNLALTILGPPVITGATGATATAQDLFSFQIQASNSPTHFAATGLPTGLNLNTTTGLISGIATTVGTFDVSLTASNSYGTSPVRNLRITVRPPRPVVTSPTSTSATVGVPFSYLITANNNPTYFASNTLPAWLSLNSTTGLLSGTPVAPGTHLINITVTNGSGSTGFNLTLTVSQASVNNAAFVSQVSPPSTMTPGQSATVQVRMRNTGTTTWNSNTPNPYRLGSQNPQDNTRWGMSRVPLASGETVIPGSTKTFTFNVVAPSTPGAYNFQWGMLREGVAWFGQFSPYVTINVVAPPPPPPSSTACDTDSNGLVNVLDVQRSINQVLQLASCTANINQTGSCEVADTQRIINAALGGACVTGPLSSVAASGRIASASRSGARGTIITLPITLSGSVPVATGMQFTLTLPAGISTISITPQAALTSTGKSVSAVRVGSAWRFAITGMNQTVIPAGNLAYLNLRINLSASTGTFSVPFANIVYTNSSGRIVTGFTDGAGSITVLSSTPPPPPPTSPATVITNAATELNAVRVYPSPWRSDVHSAHPLTFSGLTANATVKIFTVSGRFVKSVSAFNDQATWDLKNDSGDTVASGLYIYLVTDPQGNKTRGKFSVIR